MKRILQILGIACLISCTPNQTKRTSILEDVTEKEALSINLENDPNIGAPKSIWDGRTIRYQLISDIDIKSVKEIVLEPANQFASNEGKRKKEVKDFARQVTSLRTTDTIGFEHSSIWVPLTEELAFLSQDPTIPTTVYLISDLMENAPWMNFYAPNTNRQLKQSPNEIGKVFYSKVPKMGKTSHIKLVVVHQPKYEQGEFFRSIVDSIYRPILEDSLGISFKVQANI